MSEKKIKTDEAIIDIPKARIRWSDNWRRAHRRRVRPIIEEALQFAALGMYEMGVPLENDKEIKVCRTARDPIVAGTSEGISKISLSVPVTAIRPRVLQYQVSHLAVTCVHEMLHGDRFAYYPEEYDLLEHLATEGIAYCGDNQFSQMYMGGCDSFVESVKSNVNSEDIKRFTTQLEDDMLLCDIEFTEGSSQTFNKWMGNEGGGYIVGIYHVNRHLSVGTALSELMKRSARDIIFG